MALSEENKKFLEELKKNPPKYQETRDERRPSGKEAAKNIERIISKW